MQHYAMLQRNLLYTGVTRGKRLVVLVGCTAHHSVSEAHLGRYLAEWDFKWNTRKMKDGERAALIAKGIEGKRLTYRPTHETTH
jgi:ATP-dependent exoDNAse (exonuclease V) alpha subunit